MKWIHIFLVFNEIFFFLNLTLRSIECKVEKPLQKQLTFMRSRKTDESLTWRDFLHIFHGKSSYLATSSRITFHEKPTSNGSNIQFFSFSSNLIIFGINF